MLDRRILFDLTKHTKATVGRKNKDSSKNPVILLGGISIQEQHAVFETNNNVTTLKALCKEAQEFITVNGVPLKNLNPVTLKPNDRIVFGTDKPFLFKHTANDAKASKPDTSDAPITFEFAMKEKFDAVPGNN